DARVAVTQVMDANAGNPGALADRRPWLSDPGHWPIDTVRRENIGRWKLTLLSGPVFGLGLDFDEQPLRGLRKRHSMHALLLCVPARLSPDPGFEIELLPSGLKHLTPPGAGQ